MKNRRMHLMSSLGYLLALVLLQTACTQTLIVYKPSPHVDPMPEKASDQEKAERDPKAAEQWNLEKVGLDSETSGTVDFLGNYNVRVAVLSTGIDYNHEDLIGQVEVNSDEITQDSIGSKKGVDRKDTDGNGLTDDVVGWDVVDGDGFAYDRHGAGTAVAGIIAAKRDNGLGIAGLMKNVSLYPIRYINDNGQTHIAALVSALDAAAQTKADVVYVQTTQVEIGGHGQEEGVVSAELAMVEKSLEQLRKQKVPVIVGAGDALGNFGSSEIEKVLAKFENVIVVTASDANDQLPLLANASFELVSTAAPGEDILTTQPNNTYGRVHGTAYAAAHVAAAVALGKAQLGPRLQVKDLKPVLTSSRGGDLINGMTRFSRGGNRLNITKFLAELRRR